MAATFELKRAARGGILMMIYILQSKLYPLGITRTIDWLHFAQLLKITCLWRHPKINFKEKRKVISALEEKNNSITLLFFWCPLDAWFSAFCIALLYSGRWCHWDDDDDGGGKDDAHLWTIPLFQELYIPHI